MILAVLGDIADTVVAGVVVRTTDQMTESETLIGPVPLITRAGRRKTEG